MTSYAKNLAGHGPLATPMVAFMRLTRLNNYITGRWSELAVIWR